MRDNPLRNLPAVSRVIEHPSLVAAGQQYSAERITEAVRSVLNDLRAKLVQGVSADTQLESIVRCVLQLLEQESQLQLRCVINATGIILHTNLGRSVLNESAACAAYHAARGYLNLELDLETGMRSSRQNPIREGIQRITGAESGTAVNNCAAATVIVLRALAMGKEVIVSRGQLIEIGGSFRIPEIMTVSGVSLREVGTTNITRIADYERAIGPNTGLLMRVHPSNYRIRGFTETPTIDELVALGQKHNIPVVDDVGSGAMFDFASIGLPGEPLVSEGIRAGADLVLFSGDKLLGGPQAGIIAGKHTLIQRIERDPLMRAFRLDKMTLAALEATLNLYRDPVRVQAEIPTLKMLNLTIEELTSRCQRLAEQLRKFPGLRSVEVESESTFVGGGSLPDLALPTVVLALQTRDLSEDEFAKRLRTGRPSVMARIQHGKVLLDLRTVLPHQEAELLTAIELAITPRISKV